MRVLTIATAASAGILLGACAGVPHGPGYVSVSAGTAVCSHQPCPTAYPHASPYRGPGYYGPPYYGPPVWYGPSPGFGVYRGRSGRFRGFR